MKSIAPLALAGLTIASIAFGVFVMSPLVESRRSLLAAAALFAFLGLVLLLVNYVGVTD